eukprot:TRINITY_DN23231_c0_g2_i4.p1 TRINITY_DN23231_c0_g2~~TRINITY_DN23231_c0_g2_i4.p1  ORF type:complete len:137 (+),score=19.81 TRINITY_DN23231_c0_g2_i4:59-469(+)
MCGRMGGSFLLCWAVLGLRLASALRTNTTNQSAETRNRPAGMYGHHPLDRTAALQRWPASLLQRVGLRRDDGELWRPDFYLGDHISNGEDHAIFIEYIMDTGIQARCVHHVADPGNPSGYAMDPNHYIQDEVEFSR